MTALALGGTAVAVVIATRPHAAAPRLSLGLEVNTRARADAGRDAVEANVGDEVTVRARGADAVWVYLVSGGLVDRCPGPGRCRIADDEVELTFEVGLALRYRVVAVAGLRAMVPTGNLDADALEAHARGARLELRVVQAAAGSP